MSSKSDSKRIWVCLHCQRPYDPAPISFGVKMWFCPACRPKLTEKAWDLVQRFETWTLNDGKTIVSEDLKGVVYTIFLAILHKAPREPVYESLVKFTWGDLRNTLILAELLEDLSLLHENKLKPLESNYNVKPTDNTKAS